MEDWNEGEYRWLSDAGFVGILISLVIGDGPIKSGNVKVGVLDATNIKQVEYFKSLIVLKIDATRVRA